MPSPGSEQARADRAQRGHAQPAQVQPDRAEAAPPDLAQAPAPPPRSRQPGRSGPGAPARPAARVRSWLGDWVVVAGWLAALTLLSFFLNDDVPRRLPAEVSAREVLTYDAFVLAATVLPFFLYLVITEVSAAHASLGKRSNGLHVVAADGAAPSAAAVLTRNLVKVLPWQLAHLGVSRALLEVQLPWAIVFLVLSLVLLALMAGPALTGGQGLHDRLAGTWVVSADRHGTREALP